MLRVRVIQAGVLILPLLGPACAVEPLAPPPTSDEALMAKYPVAVAGTVTMVTLQPGKLGFHGFQGGTMTVTLTVSAVDKGPLAVGESLTFTGSTVLRPADLEGPISAIPPTLKMGDRVHVYLDRQQDGLVVPYWAAFRLVDKAARRLWVVVGLDGWSGDSWIFLVRLRWWLWCGAYSVRWGGSGVPQDVCCSTSLGATRLRRVGKGPDARPR